MKRELITIIFAVFAAGSVLGAQLNVPSDEYPDIMTAIQAAQEGDEIVLAAQEFIGSNNKFLDYGGKAITIRSENPLDPEVVEATIIDCEGSGQGLKFASGEGRDSILDGVTVTGAWNFTGGGVYIENSSPVIRNCIIRNNSASFNGGGIYIKGSDSMPLIANTKVIDNYSLSGGGIYSKEGKLNIENCIFAGNYSSQGGAICLQYMIETEILNSTFADNSASTVASGIYSFGESVLAVENSIFWGNYCEYTATYDTTIYVSNLGEGHAFIGYCDIQNPDQNVTVDELSIVELGEGIIDADPLFVEGGYVDEEGVFIKGDYHIQEESPCVNAGNPEYEADDGETDIDGQVRVAGKRLDIGADEVMMPVSARVSFIPRKIYLDWSTRYMSAFVKLKDNQYDVLDTDLDSILVNGEVKPVFSYKMHRKYLYLKFKTDDLLKFHTEGEKYLELNMTGQLDDGTEWKGTDKVRIYEKNWWRKQLRYWWRHCFRR